MYNNTNKQALTQQGIFEPKDLWGYPEGGLRPEDDRVQPETAVPPALWKEIAENDCAQIGFFWNRFLLLLAMSQQTVDK